MGSQPGMVFLARMTELRACSSCARAMTALSSGRKQEACFLGSILGVQATPCLNASAYHTLLKDNERRKR